MPRQVTCYKDTDNGLVFLQHVVTEFELTTGNDPYILCIIGNNLIIGKDTNVLTRPLKGSVGSSNFTLQSSLVDAIEVYGSLYLLCKTASGSGSYGAIQWDSSADTWISPTEYPFVGSEGIFNVTTSNAILHYDSWGQLFAIYGQEKQLVVNQLYSGPVFQTAAPEECKKITKVSISANERGVLVHCGDSFFVYSMEDAAWPSGTEQWGGEYAVGDIRELASPHVFAVPTLINPNNSLPGTIAFLTPDGQRVIVSLRAGTLTGSTFTQTGNLFCYSESGTSGVLCHNVSVLLSSGTTGSASYLYGAKDGATVVGSVGSKVVVEYVDPMTSDTKLDVLPDQSKDDDTKVEIDRKSLCDEMKESVPSLFKLFCGKRK